MKIRIWYPSQQQFNYATKISREKSEFCRYFVLALQILYFGWAGFQVDFYVAYPLQSSNGEKTLFTEPNSQVNCNSIWLRGIQIDAAVRIWMFRDNIIKKHWKWLYGYVLWPFSCFEKSSLIARIRLQRARFLLELLTFLDIDILSCIS